MKFLIISHTPHYLDHETIKGWGATVREIDYLASLFDEVVHIAPLHKGSVPQSSIPYKAENIHLRVVHPAGGNSIWHKLGILLKIPEYVATIRQEIANADIVHIRAPANISLVATLLLTLSNSPQKRWIKYAGNWKPDKPDAWSSRFQRWWLRRGWHRGFVTVNGQWPGDPDFVRSFVNPCLTHAQLMQGQRAAEQKALTVPINIVFVGRIETAKGVGRILDIAAQLRSAGVEFRLDLIGDGPERKAFEASAREKGLFDCTHFHGWLPRDQIDVFYEKAHFILFPSSASEGWPKVLSEAMAYGAVPIASNVSSIPQYLTQFETGRALDADDVCGFANAIRFYVENPDIWKQVSNNGVKNAGYFSYSHYLEQVRLLLGLPYGQIN